MSQIALVEIEDSRFLIFALSFIDFKVAFRESDNERVALSICCYPFSCQNTSFKLYIIKFYLLNICLFVQTVNTNLFLVGNEYPVHFFRLAFDVIYLHFGARADCEVGEFLASYVKGVDVTRRHADE